MDSRGKCLAGIFIRQPSDRNSASLIGAWQMSTHAQCRREKCRELVSYIVEMAADGSGLVVRRQFCRFFRLVWWLLVFYSSWPAVPEALNHPRFRAATSCGTIFARVIE